MTPLSSATRFSYASKVHRHKPFSMPTLQTRLPSAASRARNGHAKSGGRGLQLFSPVASTGALSVVFLMSETARCSPVFCVVTRCSCVRVPDSGCEDGTAATGFVLEVAEAPPDTQGGIFSRCDRPLVPSQRGPSTKIALL